MSSKIKSKEEILNLLKERDLLLDEDYKSDRADEIEREIIEAIRKNFNNYEVDFILETLTRFGQAPNVVYDDNGMFAVSSDGYQPVVTGDERIEGAVSIMVEKEQWKKTIREALQYYINEQS